MKLRLTIVALVSLLWGSEWIFHETLVDIPPFRLLTLRCLVAALALVPFFLRGRESFPHLPVARNLLLGMVVIALPALFLANRTDLSPGLVVVYFAMIPIITSVLGDGGGLSNTPLLLSGLAGTAFLVRGALSFSLAQTTSVLGLVLVVVAISAALVRAKRWLRGTPLPGSVMVQMLAAAVIFGGYSLMREGISGARWTVAEIVAVLCLGIFSGGIGYCGFYFVLRNAKASQATVVQWLIPVVGIAETATWLRHLPTWDSMLGGAVGVVSAGLFLRAPVNDDKPLTLQITNSSDSENVYLPPGSP
jgi:drug/metabolite transporter (DMT)-like permease